MESGSSGALAQRNDSVTIKLLMIGDSGVGKTSLITVYMDQVFRPNTVATIGVDYKQKNIEVDGTNVSLRVWDTAGQDQFRSITRQYYRGAMGILLVYDVSSLQSFTHITYWIRNIAQYASAHVPKILIANKIDVAPAMRQVPQEAGIEFAKALGVPYFECSATDYDSVVPIFEHLSKLVLNSREVLLKEDVSMTNVVKIEESPVETVKQKRCNC